MSPDSPTLAAQFADLLAVVSGSPRQSRTFLVGGVPVALSAADPRVLDAFTWPFRHLQVPDRPPQARIELLSRAETADRLRPRWTWQVALYADDRYEFRSMDWVGILEAWDSGTTTSILVVDATDLDRLRRPETTRESLERLVARFGRFSVHGGTLGDAETCVLMVGKGGSGKSSLVAHGVRAGFSSLGDDFLYLDRRDGSAPFLWSTYGTVKLAPSSPAADLVGSREEVVDGKRLGWLDDVAPGCLVAGQRPIALVVPSVGDRGSIGPADERAVLTALLPTSAMLASGRAETVRALVEFARTVPCYALSVAHDPDRELAALMSVAPAIQPRGSAAS